MQQEELRLDADVLSSEGHTLGKLHRFIIDTDGFRLTHLAINTGILRSGQPLWKGGFGLDHDRIVPVGAIESANSDEVRLTMTAEEFRDHSVDFLEEYFVPTPDVHKGALDASDLHRFAMSIPGEPGPYVMRQTTAMKPDQSDIREDSPVWRLRPHQKIGEVERVIIDDASKRVVAIVVRRGFLFTKEVVLPIERVVEVVAGIVRVEIGDDELDTLAEFKPED